METGRKASRVYDGMREDEKEQKVPVPSKGKVDNTRGPLGYNHGVGEEDKGHGPGVGLKGNAADNSPSPVPRKR